MPKTNPIHLAFRVAGTDKFHVFTLIGGKVRTDYMIDRSDSGSLVCGCALFRHESKCEHVQLLTTETSTRVLSFDAWLEGDLIDWQSLDPFAAIAVFDTTTNGVGVLDLEAIGDVSLETLNRVLTVTGESGTGVGSLNPNRIYAGCLASVKHGVGVGAPQVVEAESDADEAPASATEEFDDSLASKGDDAKVEEPVVAEVKPEVKPVVEEPSFTKIKRPNPKNFFVEKDTWLAICYALSRGENVLLTGPTGSGKSELAYIVAKALGLNLEPFNMGAMSEPRTSLIGNTHFDKSKGTWFSESRFVRAVTADAGIVLLDEITRSDIGAFNILLPLMDRQGYLALDEAEDAPVVKRGKKVGFIATANVGMEYTGTQAMDAALKNRFSIVIDMWFPPRAQETKILLSRCDGLTDADANRLVDIAKTQRDLARNDGEFEEMVSTRALIAAGQAIGSGVPFKVACKFAIENLFSSEGGDASDRTKVKQIIQKGG